MSHPGPMRPPTDDPEFNVHQIGGVMTFGTGVAAIVAFGGTLAWIIGVALIVVGLFVTFRGVLRANAKRR